MCGVGSGVLMWSVVDKGHSRFIQRTLAAEVGLYLCGMRVSNLRLGNVLPLVSEGAMGEITSAWFCIIA
jgi:hypothetical protein